MAFMSFHDLLIGRLSSGRGKKHRLKGRAGSERVYSAHLSRLEGDLNVAALDGQVEAHPLILHKVQGDLWEALELEVGDDGLAAEGAVADHRQHLIKLVLQQRQLEHVLGCVHLLNGTPGSAGKKTAGTVCVTGRRPGLKEQMHIKRIAEASNLCSQIDSWLDVHIPAW